MRRSSSKRTSLNELTEYVEFMKEHDLTELAVEEGKESRSIRMRRGAEIVAAPAAPAQPTAQSVAEIQPTADQADAGDFDIIRAPMVGAFYRRPRPDESAFVDVGDKVKEGDVLCIIEAMKLMNHIEADFDAEIIEILVENAAPVEYGQPLFRVRR